MSRPYTPRETAKFMAESRRSVDKALREVAIITTEYDYFSPRRKFWLDVDAELLKLAKRRI